MISILSVGWFMTLKARSLDSICPYESYLCLSALRTGGDAGVYD